MGITQTLLTTAKITNESARILTNNLVFGRAANRDYDSEFGVRNAKIGSTVNIRMPIRPRGRVGPVIDPTAIKEAYVPLSFTGPIGVDYVFNSTEMYFAIDDFSNRFIRPAMVALANQIDLALFNTLAANTGNTIGVPGGVLTKEAAADAVLLAQARLTEMGMPVDDGLAVEVNSPQFNALLSGNNMRLFNDRAEVSDIYRKGRVGTYGGFEHYISNNVSRHTNGTFTGTPLVLGVGQSGNTLITDGWGANSSLNVGDTFTIAGVGAVAPQTYQALGYDQPFTVTAKTVTAGGVSTISISPAIDVGPGGGQNVTAGPADNAALTVLGTTGQTFSQAIAFHRDALVLASADLDVPPNIEGSYMRDPDSGIGVRYIRQFDARTDQWISRFDVMIAMGSLYPQLAVRIVS